MRTGYEREGLLRLVTNLFAVCRARRGRACDERSASSYGVARSRRHAQANQHDGASSSLRFYGWRQARELEAKLVDRPGRKDEVVRIRDGVRVARSSDKSLG